MQTDMHYYGTFALARAAGMSAPAAGIIATAAEYVDDSDYVDIQLDDEAFIHAPPTAHHPTNKENILPVDQRRVWVPFHFIPGNQGDSTAERMICRKDSDLAREMVEFHLSGAGESYILERMGIAAHVYADTFSHYGFSGISSHFNKVAADSISLLNVRDGSFLEKIMRQASDFEDKYIKGRIADAVGLGHGSVATYPDRPYLQWRFTYADPAHDSGVRSNQVTFLEAAEKLHGIFSRLAALLPNYAEPGGGRSFASIRETVSEILALEAGMDSRIYAWQMAAAKGKLFKGEEIPPYSPDVFSADVEAMSQHTTESVQGTNAYGFLRAAQLHREFVLHTLLPKYGLTTLLQL